MTIFKKIQTPLGPVYAGDNGGQLSHLVFDLPRDAVFGESSLLEETSYQLEEYFSGKRREFDLPLCAEGTEFQKKVWQALQDIPYGQTRSYGQIASAIGNPKACRAVGMANNRNPISIIIPCHRVIGADGAMIGYGGGLDKKAFLLRLEREN